MKCPKCNHSIPAAEVKRANAAIVARRRRRAGNQMTSEQARARQVRSVEARRANAAAVGVIEHAAHRLRASGGQAGGQASANDDGPARAVDLAEPSIRSAVPCPRQHPCRLSPGGVPDIKAV